MRLPRWLIPAAVVLILTAAAVVYFGKPKPVRVKVIHPAVGRVEEIVTANSVGTVEPEKIAVISAEIAGRIRAIRIRQGRAKAGQLVVELETDVAQAQMEQAELRRKKIWEDLERWKGVDVPKGDVDRLTLDLAIAKADEQIARLTLDKARVAAPFDGIVVKLHSEEGEWVIPGKALFTLHSAGPPLIRAPIDEVDMGRLALSLPARLGFDNYYGKKFEGVVHEIMPAASADQKNNRTVDIKIRASQMPPNILAGMSANVEIVIQAKEGATCIPTHLIHDDREGHGKYVFVAQAGRARRKQVTPGISNWETTEIVDGLAPADEVIVPLQFEDERTVADGMPVTVVPHGK